MHRSMRPTRTTKTIGHMSCVSIFFLVQQYPTSAQRIKKNESRRYGLSPFRLCRRFDCRRFGLSPLWFVTVSALSPLWFVAVSVCRRYGLSPFRFVAVMVCRRFGSVAVLTVAVSVCRRFDSPPHYEVLKQLQKLWSHVQ